MDERQKIKELRIRIGKTILRCEEHPIACFDMLRLLKFFDKELDTILGEENPLDLPGQAEWKQLQKDRGEESAERIVARKLREFADLIENVGYPKILGVHLDNTGKFEGLMESIEVTISHPWPG